MIILTKNNNHASKQGAVISLKHWRSQTTVCLLRRGQMVKINFNVLRFDLLFWWRKRSRLFDNNV